MNVKCMIFFSFNLENGYENMLTIHIFFVFFFFSLFFFLCFVFHLYFCLAFFFSFFSFFLSFIHSSSNCKHTYHQLHTNHANMPMHYAETHKGYENEMKKKDILFIFAQNIDCRPCAC